MRASPESSIALSCLRGHQRLRRAGPAARGARFVQPLCCALWLFACDPVDRCVHEVGSLSLDEPGGTGLTYAELLEPFVGSHTVELYWLPSQDGPYDVTFDRTGSTVAAIDVDHDGRDVQRDRWRAIDPSDEPYCPTDLTILGLAVRFKTDDGALDESFVYEWTLTEPPPDRIYISANLDQPGGTLRVQDEVSDDESAGYGISCEISEGRVEYATVSYGISRIYLGEEGAGGWFWSVDLATSEPGTNDPSSSW